MNLALLIKNDAIDITEQNMHAKIKSALNVSFYLCFIWTFRMFKSKKHNKKLSLYGFPNSLLGPFRKAFSRDLSLNNNKMVCLCMFRILCRN